MAILLILYWILAFGLIPVGLVMLIASKNDEKKRKTAIRFLIASIILIIIGGGVCGFILMNLN